MQVKAVRGGKYTVTLSTPFKGEVEWDVDGYVINLTGAKLREVAASLGVKVTSRSRVAEIRSAMRAALVDMAVAPAPGEDVTIPTTEDTKWSLFYRATSLGYDKGAAMRVAETVEAYGHVSDPCVKHPGMSTTVGHMGYAADGCEACEVIELSDGQGFNQADEMERLRRLDNPTPAERAEDALKYFTGTDIVNVNGVEGFIQSVGYGQVTIHTREGVDAGYSKIYPCQPIVARILGGQITIMLDGRPDCVCALATEAGAPNLPQGGFACPGCGSVFVPEGTEASAEVLATSQAAIERKQAASYAAWVDRTASDPNVEIIGGHPYSKGSKAPIFRNVPDPRPSKAVELPEASNDSPFMRTLRSLLTLDM